MSYEKILDRILDCDEILAQVLIDLRKAKHEVQCYTVQIRSKGPEPKYTDPLFRELTKIEDALARGAEAHEKLLTLQGKLEDEHNNPHCPACGEYDQVRTAVDDEGPHNCTSR